MPEPYSPFLPSGSPRVLVLAESQNLSDTNEDYVGWLQQLDRTGKFLRLMHCKPGADGDLGIQPWDDGTLQFAVQAALKLDPATVAVSNAVPWSWVEGNANARPFTQKVLALAAEFWNAIFEAWLPDRIVAAGAVARDVMRLTGQVEDRLLPLALPSPRLNTAAAMFDVDDLMDRFDIEDDIQEMIRRSDSSIRSRLAFYVCHAVSRSC